jgi:hypothetical protein
MSNADADDDVLLSLCLVNFLLKDETRFMIFSTQNVVFNTNKFDHPLVTRFITNGKT